MNAVRNRVNAKKLFSTSSRASGGTVAVGVGVNSALTGLITAKLTAKSKNNKTIVVSFSFLIGYQLQTSISKRQIRLPVVGMA